MAEPCPTPTRSRTEADVAEEIEAMYLGWLEDWLSRPYGNRGEKPVSSMRHVGGSRSVRLRFPDGSVFDVKVRRRRGPGGTVGNSPKGARDA